MPDMRNVNFEEYYRKLAKKKQKQKNNGLLNCFPLNEGESFMQAA